MRVRAKTPEARMEARMAMRVHDDLRRKIERAARASGKTMSREIDERLRASFETKRRTLERIKTKTAPEAKPEPSFDFSLQVRRENQTALKP